MASDASLYCRKASTIIILENRACRYYHRLIDAGSIQGSHWPVVNRGGTNGKRANGFITHPAKLSIDRSVKLTATD